MAKYPIQRYGASTREPSSSNDKLVKTLISSNVETQRSMTKVIDSLNGLILMLKESDNETDSEKLSVNQMPINQSQYSNSSASLEANKQILQRLNNLEGQHRQIVEALNVIINHLKRFANEAK